MILPRKAMQLIILARSYGQRWFSESFRHHGAYSHVQKYDEQAYAFSCYDLLTSDKGNIDKTLFS